MPLTSQFIRAIAPVMLSFFIALNPLNTSANGLNDLEKFLSDIRSGSASFTQTVVTPARAGESAGRTKISSGRFEFARPDRFRFDYRKPFEQTIVADGTTLWLYDADLNQVTSRAQAQTLGSTPAALLASGTSLAQLGAVFDFKAESDADGLRWAQALPREREGSLKRVRVGFAQGQLAVLDIEDQFGQRSTLRFESFKLNPGFAQNHFTFKPPAGADVLKQ
jgi:outer membrane lipoprotein carrier protein